MGGRVKTTKRGTEPSAGSIQNVEVADCKGDFCNVSLLFCQYNYCWDSFPGLIRFWGRIYANGGLSWARRATMDCTTPQPFFCSSACDPFHQQHVVSGHDHALYAGSVREMAYNKLTKLKYGQVAYRVLNIVSTDTFDFNWLAFMAILSFTVLHT